MIRRHPLPSRPRSGLYNRRQAVGEQIPGLAQVYNVEDDSLVFLGIFHSKMKPEPARKKCCGN